MKITIERLQSIVEGLPDPDTYHSQYIKVPYRPEMFTWALLSPRPEVKVYELTFHKVPYYPLNDNPYRDWRRTHTWELQL